MGSNRRLKNIIIVILIIAVASMSVAFSAFAQTLSISGVAKVNSNSNNWNVSFDDIVALSTTGYATGTKNSDSTQKNITFSCEFLATNDSCELTASIINKGSINAMLKSYNYTVSSNGQTLYTGTSDYTGDVLQIDFSVPSNWQSNTTVLEPNDSGTFKMKATLIDLSSLSDNTKYTIDITFDFEQS